MKYILPIVLICLYASQVHFHGKTKKLLRQAHDNTSSALEVSRTWERTARIWEDSATNAVAKAQYWRDEYLNLKDLIDFIHGTNHVENHTIKKP